MSEERFELEPGTGEFTPPRDPRPKMPEPLPVRLVAVADVTLPALAGLETRMDDLYINLLGFIKATDIDTLAYDADNFRLIFEFHESLIERDTLRPLQVVVLSLAETERLLIEREMEYIRQKGLLPGCESLLLRDPSGNWVEVTESRSLG